MIEDITHLEIFNIEKFTLDRSYEIKLLNQYASNERNIIIPYDDFSKVVNATVYILNNTGKTLRKYSLQDFDDIGFDSGVASSSRGKYLEIRNNQYPFYIKVSYKVNHKGSLHFPVWDPQPSSTMKVLKSNFSVSNRSGSDIRYKSINIDPKVDSSTTEKKMIVWEIENLEPYKKESFSFSHYYSPIVFTAPTSFSIDGYDGSMDSWKEFGLWIRLLNLGKGNLDDNQKKEIREIIEGIDSKEQIVRAVYSYLQETTRYASIQLGIGGWSPFDAAYVHENKYGDCKALSYYTKSMLDEVGIKSYYTLIRARKYANPIFTDFPNAHFNHAILTVPMEKDTIWLECTSQTNPFGYLGTFTGNRKGLMISENGGEIIQTQKYDHSTNRQLTKGKITIDKDGSNKSDITRLLSGVELENDGFINVITGSNQTLKNWCTDNLDFGTIKIDSVELFNITDEVIPKAGFRLKASIKSIAQKNGKRLFINASIFSNAEQIKLSDQTRITPLEIRHGYQHIDSITIEFDHTFELESIPNSDKIHSKFGEYARSISATESCIQYFRKFVLKEGKYPPEDYMEFSEFISKVQKYDRRKIVIVSD